MKEVVVQRIQQVDSLDDLKRTLTLSTKHEIDQINWENYSDGPAAGFHILHDGSNFYLHYVVKGEKVRAVNTLDNSNVFQDSCCEFFISLDNCRYYNLEVNAIGTKLFGYGRGRDRSRFSRDVLQSIETISSLGSSPIDDPFRGKEDWDLTIKMPFSVFVNDAAVRIPGGTFRGNFYKCGDKTDDVHYRSWNPIASLTPDFHVMESFASLIIEQ
ncbi:hypothetical protein CSB45_02515 [candidate division KSB3 bacterium]|uniref:Carbohydrate-binding domain-containing protein n=1 Tax=candidate division KSB3 bacterium TaxID=2044937 RepID=A0A2G6EAM0_9BACT|nr:MAG: hypothetical protein CSB45_02515 [candidate division KSB3 bacterium]PIE30953.1 MAG: hypothetical protein CSA57_01130 [candidate division KSB3 bacterium]